MNNSHISYGLGKVVCCRQIVFVGRNNFLDSGAKRKGKGETIRDKFALPVAPGYVIDVTLPAGARVRVGEAKILAIERSMNYE